MKNIKQQLQSEMQHHKGTALAGLLQWAVLHIEDQDAAIEQKDCEIEQLTADNTKMHRAIKDINDRLTVLSGVAFDAFPMRDYEATADATSHINIMGVHYKDPDYMRGKVPAPHKDAR